MHYVNDINLVPKMGQIIKVQRPVSSAPISGMYVILEAAFTIALLGSLLYKSIIQDTYDKIITMILEYTPRFYMKCMTGHCRFIKYK